MATVIVVNGEKSEAEAAPQPISPIEEAKVMFFETVNKKNAADICAALWETAAFNLGSDTDSNNQHCFHERWVCDYRLVVDRNLPLNWGTRCVIFIALTLAFKDMVTWGNGDHQCVERSTAYHLLLLVLSSVICGLGAMTLCLLFFDLRPARANIRRFFYKKIFRPRDSLASAYVARKLLTPDGINATANAQFNMDYRIAMMQDKMVAEALSAVKIELPKIKTMVQRRTEYATESKELLERLEQLETDLQPGPDATNKIGEEIKKEKLKRDMLMLIEKHAPQNDERDLRDMASTKKLSDLYTAATMARARIFRLIFPWWICLTLFYAIWIHFNYDEIASPANFMDRSLSEDDLRQYFGGYPVLSAAPWNPNASIVPREDGVFNYCNRTGSRAGMCASAQTCTALLSFCRSDYGVLVELLAWVQCALVSLMYLWQGIKLYAGTDCLNELWPVEAIAPNAELQNQTSLYAQSPQIMKDEANVLNDIIVGNDKNDEENIRRARYERWQIDFGFKFRLWAQIVLDGIVIILAGLYVGTGIPGPRGSDFDEIKNVTTPWMYTFCIVVFSLSAAVQDYTRLTLTYVTRKNVYSLYNRLPGYALRLLILRTDMIAYWLKLVTMSVLASVPIATFMTSRRVEDKTDNFLLWLMIFLWLLVLAQALAHFYEEKKDQTPKRTANIFLSQTIDYESAVRQEIEYDPDFVSHVNGNNKELKGRLPEWTAPAPGGDADFGFGQQPADTYDEEPLLPKRSELTRRGSNLLRSIWKRPGFRF